MFDKNAALKLQQSLKNAGFDPQGVDGLWGKDSQAALDASFAKYDIAWSKSVAPEFVTKVKDIVSKIGGDPSHLMSCMAFETGRTFSPTIKNGAGAPYYGIIQGGAAFCKDVGITLDQWRSLTALQQLDYVYKWYLPYKGRMKDLPSWYMRILWPAAVSQPDSYVLWDSKSRPTTYIQNKGLDVNKDGQITRGEVSKVIYNIYAEGCLIANRRPR